MKAANGTRRSARVFRDARTCERSAMSAAKWLPMSAAKWLPMSEAKRLQ
jgi:hypothetical protein